MKARILCVDDIPDNLHLLSAVLEDEGYECILAANGQEALDKVREQRPDAILLDIMMPGINGWQVLELLRKQYSLVELPIIMATALGDVEDIVRALELGANDYVVKPLEIEVVLARLQTNLRVMQLTRERDELARMREEFLAIASHDLRNPLSNILGLTELLSLDAAPGREFQFLKLIMGAARKMHTLIDDFLDVESLGQEYVELNLQQVEISELVKAAIDQQSQYALSKEITLQPELVPSYPTITADPNRLAQVFDNLLGNAIKFSPPGTCVLVRTVLENGYASVEVTDAGPGLTDEDRMQVFQKYARLSNKPTGTEKSMGLGLYICRKLIEAHGGKIGTRNNPEQGTTFWFSLPL